MNQIKCFSYYLVILYIIKKKLYDEDNIYMHAVAQHVSFFLISPFPVFLFSFDFVVSFDVRVL
jgi:hypothetical protein